MRSLSVFLLLLTCASADESSHVEKAPPKRYLVYASFAFNAYTHLAARSHLPAADLTPDKRALISQQVGFAYFVDPSLRLTLTVAFGETLTNAPAGTNTLSSLSFIPWVVFSKRGFFTGGGFQFSPISYGKAPNFDAGIYTATGYAVTLGHDLSMPLGVQLVFMFNQRFSFAINPTVGLAYRF